MGQEVVYVRTKDRSGVHRDGWIPDPEQAKVVRRSKVLAYETMRDIARRMWDKPPFLLGGAQAQHGAVGSEVLIRDIPGLSGIRPGNPILAGAKSFARGSDQKGTSRV